MLVVGKLENIDKVNFKKNCHLFLEKTSIIVVGFFLLPILFYLKIVTILYLMFFFPSLINNCREWTGTAYLKSTISLTTMAYMACLSELVEGESEKF